MLTTDTIMERFGRGSGSTRAIAASGRLAALAGVAWYIILMSPIWTAAAVGPICGHQGLLVAHCPACYTAVALAVAGLGLISVAWN